MCPSTVTEGAHRENVLETGLQMRQNFPRHYLVQECGEFARSRGESQDISVPSGLGRTCCCNGCSADLSGLRADLLFGSQSSVGGGFTPQGRSGAQAHHPPGRSLSDWQRRGDGGVDVALAISVYIHLARQGSVTCPTNTGLAGKVVQLVPKTKKERVWGHLKLTLTVPSQLCDTGQVTEAFWAG